jgi:hypothetical protein
MRKGSNIRGIDSSDCVSIRNGSGRCRGNLVSKRGKVHGESASVFFARTRISGAPTWGFVLFGLRGQMPPHPERSRRKLDGKAISGKGRTLSKRTERPRDYRQGDSGALVASSARSNPARDGEPTKDSVRVGRNGRKVLALSWKCPRGSHPGIGRGTDRARRAVGALKSRGNDDRSCRLREPVSDPDSDP